MVFNVSKCICCSSSQCLIFHVLLKAIAAQSINIMLATIISRLRCHAYVVFFLHMWLQIFDIPQRTFAQPHRFQWENFLLVYVLNFRVCAFFAFDEQLCVKPLVLNYICPIFAYSCAYFFLVFIYQRWLHQGFQRLKTNVGHQKWAPTSTT
jgi:hypothetical protein